MENLHWEGSIRSGAGDEGVSVGGVIKVECEAAGKGKE